MIGGGGGAGLYSVGIARRLGVKRGRPARCRGRALCDGRARLRPADDFADDEVMTTDAFDHDRAAPMLAALRAEGRGVPRRRAGAGASRAEVRFCGRGAIPPPGVGDRGPARDTARCRAPEHVAELCEDFHQAHEELFAVRDTDSPVEFVTWRAHARCTLADAAARSAPTRALDPRARRRATAYFPATRRGRRAGPPPRRSLDRRDASRAGDRRVAGHDRRARRARRRRARPERVAVDRRRWRRRGATMTATADARRESAPSRSRSSATASRASPAR